MLLPGAMGSVCLPHLVEELDHFVIDDKDNGHVQADPTQARDGTLVKPVSKGEARGEQGAWRRLERGSTWASFGGAGETRTMTPHPALQLNPSPLSRELHVSWSLLAARCYGGAPSRPGNSNRNFKSAMTDFQGP